jgi:hypothetical protein
MHIHLGTAVRHPDGYATTDPDAQYGRHPARALCICVWIELVTLRDGCRGAVRKAGEPAPPSAAARTSASGRLCGSGRIPLRTAAGSYDVQVTLGPDTGTAPITVLAGRPGHEHRPAPGRHRVPA